LRKENDLLGWHLTGHEQRNIAGFYTRHIPNENDNTNTGAKVMATSTIKVKILTDCEFCEGKAYIPEGEEVDSFGGIYTKYIPCKHCEGSGLMSKYINLVDFIRLMETIDIFEPDYKALGEEVLRSQYIDSMESAGLK
jgi:hypothetical protein